METIITTKSYKRKNLKEIIITPEELEDRIAKACLTEMEKGNKKNLSIDDIDRLVQIQIEIFRLTNRMSTGIKNYLYRLTTTNSIKRQIHKANNRLWFKG